MEISGWKLDSGCRAALLKRFPPAWSDIVADHVTLDPQAAGASSLPDPANAEIVGSVDDGDGVQAMVVAIEGSTARPDGGTYHITWSLDRAKRRRAVESNDVIRRLGWRMLETPVPIRLVPAWID